MELQYDIVVLGSGPGGYMAAVYASRLGFKTAIIEKEELGGVCVNWGCIPTKAILKTIEILKNTKTLNKFGLELGGEIRPIFQKIMQRSRRIAAISSKGVETLLKKHNIDIFQGYGTLKDNSSILIDNKKVISGKNIIIATGAKPKDIPVMKSDGKNILNYKDVLALTELPRSILIVGAGAIGCEFAHIFNSLGVQVTVIEFLPDILPFEDKEISSFVYNIFKKNKIKVYRSSYIKGIEIKDNNCEVFIQSSEGELRINVEKVFSAVGVISNIANIGLEEVNIDTEDSKIKVDSMYRTNVSGIYAIGDVIDTPALAHVASAEARICVEYIAGLNPEPVDYSNIPSCTYIEPEVSSLGYTEKQLQEKGIEYRVGKYYFAESGKALTANAREGFIKLLFEKNTEQLFGAHITGYHATELITALILAKSKKMTARDIYKCVLPHPTMSEAIKEAAYQIKNL